MDPLVRTIAITMLAGLALIPPCPAAGDEAPPSSASGPVRLFDAEFNLPANSRWREERIMTAPKLKLSVDLGGNKTVKGTMSMLSRQVVDIDVLTEASLRLRFVQSDRTSDIDFGNNRSRQTSTLPLDGRTVLTQRNADGRWSAKFDGRRRPTGEESAALRALTYLWSDGIYPDREVAIGGIWKVDAKEFKNLFGSDFRNPVGEFEFKLARLVEHEGQTCAKITGKGQLTSQTKNLDGAAGTEQTALDAEMDLTIEIYRSVDLAMDLTVEMKGTLELSNKQDKDALRYNASSEVEFTRRVRKR